MKKKKKNRTVPTPRQKKAFELLAEDGGKSSMRAILNKAGYTDITACTPTKVTSTKGWQQLLDEYLPEEDLTRHHKELLNQTRIEHMVFPTATSDDEIKELIRLQGCEVKKIQHGDTATHVWYFVADAQAKKSAIEMGYRLRGSFKKDNEQKAPIINVLPPERIEAIQNALEDI